MYLFIGDIFTNLGSWLLHTSYIIRKHLIFIQNKVGQVVCKYLRSDGKGRGLSIL